MIFSFQQAYVWCPDHTLQGPVHSLVYFMDLTVLC